MKVHIALVGDAVEHRPKLGRVHMAALAGERPRLPVQRHRVARLRYHHLGVEVGTVEPALADLGRRRCEEDALPIRARQLLAYPAYADRPRGDELDLLAHLALAERVEVGATAGLADAVLVGDGDLLLDEGQLGAPLQVLLACFLAGRFTLFGRPLRGHALACLSLGVGHLLGLAAVEGAEELLDARVLARQVLLQPLDQRLEHQHDRRDDRAHGGVEVREVEVEVDEAGHALKGTRSPRNV